MALFRPGSIVGQISGRIGGVVYSHNRGGSYIRSSAIPIAVESESADAAKARVTALSRLWADLDDDERAAWRAYAQSDTRRNRLGDSRALTGICSFIAINSRMLLAEEEMLRVPALGVAPQALAYLSMTADIGTGTCELTFSPTPLDTDLALWIVAGVVSSPGRRYHQDVMRVIKVTAGAQTSPYDYQSDIEKVHGDLIVGQQVYMRVSVFDRSSGLLSGPMLAEKTVTSSTGG